MEVRTDIASSSGEPSNPPRRLEAKDLPSLRRLGKGLSGVVYETAWEGNKYARKDFPLGRVKCEVFIKEVPALFELEHPNVVKCYGYAVGGTSCSLLLEYLDDSLQNTTQGRMEAHRKKNLASSTSTRSRALALDVVKSMLSNKVKERAGADVSGNNIDEGGSGSGNCLTVIPFEIPEAVDIISQIAAGMKYLHDERIVHGDLKPKNVLVCSDESGKLVVKVTDFGLVQTKKQIRLVSKRARHFEILTWKAPELFSKLLGPLTDDPCFTDSDTDSGDDDSEIIDQGSEYFPKSRLAMADVYSFGLICSHLLGGKVLYPEWSLIQLRKQRSGSTLRPELLSPAIPEYLRALIYSTLRSDPLSRPTFSDICAAGALLPLPPKLRDAMKVHGEEDLMALTTLPFDNWPSLDQLPGSEIGASTTLTTIESHIELGAKKVAGFGRSNVIDSDYVLESKHKVFLSHSGAQKDFVEQLCVDLQRLDRYPFFDKLRSSLPIGEIFPNLIFEAIGQCHVGVLVFSEDFFMKTKWPMLELNAMMKEFEKPKSRIKIISLFYGISFNHWKDPKNQSLWISRWEEWARDDKRIVVEEWKKALRVLESIKGLEMKEGMEDVKFRREIVEDICGMVAPETRWDDSHIKGLSHICEVICKKMDERSSKSTPCVVGLYGMGGIGKTTTCKALCNYLALKFHDNVCHVELGQGNEMKMLQKALKVLTTMSNEILDKLDDMEQGFTYLKERMQDVPVFLALDNVQDDYKSIQEAQAYLRGGYGVGSMVLVTARSMGVLRKLNVEERQCIEMPELEEDEAMSLFLQSSGILFERLVDKQILRKCIQVCYLQKVDGVRRHYHPLALKVLGQQLGSNPESWEMQLNKIKKINELDDMEVSIFSILRSSFDSLPQKLKLIFMDVALITSSVWMHFYNEIEWLCMVHGESVANMKDMLMVLKRRSILEKLSDDLTMLGMHDLWREFAILESSKAQDSRDPRWVYQADGRRAIQRSGQWRESVERMVFVNDGWKGLEGLHLADFVNVEAFKLIVEVSMRDWSLDMDLSGLTNLKSLEVRTPGMVVNSDGLYSLMNLRYLQWSTCGVSQCLGGIGRLTALQVLQLSDCKGVKVLDLMELKLLRVVFLLELPDLICVVGLDSRMVSLRYLAIAWCGLFRDCSGLGELSGLGDLEFFWCGNLKELPWLGRLIRLRKLVISGCKSLRAVPGLGDLVNLEELEARGCLKLDTLLGMAKLTKLRRLDLERYPLQEVLWLDGLVALTTIRASFSKLQGEPLVLSKLPTLISLSIEGWNGQLWTVIQNMAMLEDLYLSECVGEDVVPDLQSRRVLKFVRFLSCNFKDLSGLSNATALESLSISNCKHLQRLPKFERLTSLKDLCITGSPSISDWPNVSSLCSLQGLEIDKFSMMKIVFVCETWSGLRELRLRGSECENVLSMASLSHVEVLSINQFDATEALDLSNFSQLKVLNIFQCPALRRVTCSIPLSALTRMFVWNCRSLVELPDLSAFPQLKTLKLHYCSALTRLSCSSPLTALREIDLAYCGDGIEILPELTWFPNLVRTRAVEYKVSPLEKKALLP